MSVLTVIFVLIIAVCVFVTVIINLLTAKYSNFRNSKKELETLIKNQRVLQQQSKSAEEETAAQNELEKAWQAYDAALLLYNESIKRFPGIIAAGILSFKAIPEEEKVKEKRVEFKPPEERSTNMQYVKLNNGLEMPMLGYGCFKVEDGQVTVDSVKCALEMGYRSIDTAAVYRNEKSVGQAMKESGVPRGEIFLTTKLWNDAQRTGEVEAAFQQSLDYLGTDYVDLYLIHWPVKEKYVDAWLAMEKIYASGRAKAIGISNFKEHHIEDIKKVWSVVPQMNQFEMHPYLSQKPLIDFCKKEGIVPQSWSPLGGSWNDGAQDSLLENAVIKEIAAKYGKSPAQVILRWNVDLGVVVIPKSVTPSRIKDNIDIFDFALTAEDIAAIDALNQDKRSGPDPDNISF